MVRFLGVFGVGRDAIEELGARHWRLM